MMPELDGSQDDRDDVFDWRAPLRTAPVTA